MEKIEKLNNFLFKNLTTLLVLTLLLYLFLGVGDNKNSVSNEESIVFNSSPKIATSRMMAMSADSISTYNSVNNSKVIKTYSLSIEVENSKNDDFIIAEDHRVDVNEIALSDLLQFLFVMKMFVKMN